MKAVAIDDFATDPTLHDLPDPTPGEGEVLVRVEASSVNGMDRVVASGMVKAMMEYPSVTGPSWAPANRDTSTPLTSSLPTTSRPAGASKAGRPAGRLRNPPYALRPPVG
jgi:hypothetical protein